MPIFHFLFLFITLSNNGFALVSPKVKLKMFASAALHSQCFLSFHSFTVFCVYRIVIKLNSVSMQPIHIGMFCLFNESSRFVTPLNWISDLLDVCWEFRETATVHEFRFHFRPLDLNGDFHYCYYIICVSLVKPILIIVLLLLLLLWKSWEKLDFSSIESKKKKVCVIQSISWSQNGDHVWLYQNCTNSKSIQLQCCRVKYRELSIIEYQIPVYQNEYRTKLVAQSSIIFLIE